MITGQPPASSDVLCKLSQIQTLAPDLHHPAVTMCETRCDFLARVLSHLDRVPKAEMDASELARDVAVMEEDR
jgi:hypothetical protein